MGDSACPKPFYKEETALSAHRMETCAMQKSLADPLIGRLILKTTLADPLIGRLILKTTLADPPIGHLFRKTPLQTL